MRCETLEESEAEAEAEAKLLMEVEEREGGEDASELSTRSGSSSSTAARFSDVDGVGRAAEGDGRGVNFGGDFGEPLERGASVMSMTEPARGLQT